MLDFSESGECRQKLLMDLPDTARLISNGYEIAPQSTYLIDRESNVYIYLDELKAAVESEYAYACDENGDQIAFSVQTVSYTHLDVYKRQLYGLSDLWG